MMLRVLGQRARLCDGITRRELMQVGAISTLGLSLPRLFENQAAGSQSTSGSAKAIILVNLIGGPSHLDMFDMKPDAPVEIRGEFQPIATTVPGLQICEHMPRISGTMHLSTLIRTHTHLYNTHSPYNMLTGYSGPVIVNNMAKLTDHPSIGSVMQYAGIRANGIPSYVWMPAHPGHSQGNRRAGPYGGFLGRQYDPVFTSYEAKFAKQTENRDAKTNPPTPIADVELPLLDRLPEIALDRLSRRRTLLQQFDDQAARIESSRSIDNLNYYKQQAFELLTTKKSRDAFDLSKEPQSVRQRYGHNLFGSCMLTALRLVEAGVKFVGVTTESQFGGGMGPANGIPTRTTSPC